MRNISTTILILALFILALLSGYNYFKRPFLERFVQDQAEPETVQETNDDIVVAAMARLSETEKLSQLISMPVVLGVSESSASADAKVAFAQRVVDIAPGFITIFGRNLTFEEVSEFTQALVVDELKQAPLIAVDHEGGSVQRLRGEGFSILPVWRQNCQTESAKRALMFSESARQLREAGVHIVFAPVIDVARSGSFIGNRACLTEDEAVSTASDFILSFAQNGILSVVKHFPGIGGVAADLHFQSATTPVESRDTRPFERIMQTFPNIGVMTTHVIVEDATDGLPCSLSALCLTQFSTHFPEVLLFTDALEMDSAGTDLDGLGEKTLSQRAIQALSAGNTVLVFGETVTTSEIKEIIEALRLEYASNEIFREQVERSVKKVLELKLGQPTE